MATTIKRVNVKANRDGVLFAALKDIEIQKGFNVRGNAKPDEELLASIKENNVIRPIHVRWKSKKKEALYIIDGERRYNAAIANELGSVPIVHHGHLLNRDAVVISLTSNRSQKKLSKKEQFSGFRRLKVEGMSPSAISKIMAVDPRTVIEALKVQEKGSRELKQAAQKSVSKGGIDTRAAARAASLPKKTQQKIIPKLKGKSQQEAIRTVRQAENKAGLGKSRPGPKAKPTVGKVKQVLCADANERVISLEKAVRNKLRLSPTHRVLNGQLLILECLKGKMQPTDLFKWEDMK